MEIFWLILQTLLLIIGMIAIAFTVIILLCIALFVLCNIRYKGEEVFVSGIGGGIIATALWQHYQGNAVAGNLLLIVAGIVAVARVVCIFGA